MTLAASVLAAAAPTPVNVVYASKPTTPTTVVAVASSGQSFGAPAVLTTAAGTSLLSYYVQAPNTSRVLQLQRQSGAGAWSPVALAQGALDTFGTPALVEDPATGRVLLTVSANASGDLAGTLGTYLWWSADQGATWTGPIKVWNYFGVGDAAPDGAGGFYSTSGQTDAQIIHVPAGYAMVTSPTGQIKLTDKLGSRGALGLATAGVAHTPIFGFYNGAAIFAHRGATYDPGLDTQVFGNGSLGTILGVAGDATGAALATSHIASYGTSGTSVLWLRSMDPATGGLGPEHRLSSGQAFFFQLRALPTSGAFVAVWRDNDDANLYVARSTGGADGRWSTSQVIGDTADSVSYYAYLDVSDHWAVGLGNRDSDSAGVVWAARADPEGVTPTLAATGRATYSPRRGNIRATLAVNTPGRIRLVATIQAPGRKATIRKTYRSTGYGKVRTTTKLPRSARRLLAQVPRAKVAVKVTFTNPAGSAKVTLAVRSRVVSRERG